MEKKVLVVDLDGTLYTINTFHYFLKFLVSFSILKFKIHLFVLLIWFMFLRGIRLVSHAKMKYFILKQIESFQIDYKIFVSSIEKYKRNIGELRDPKYNMKILATAAPACYANIIAKNEKFDICLGTKVIAAESFKPDFENKGEVKKEKVLQYLKSVGSNQVDTFITDHLDDLPLMKISSSTIVYCPTKIIEAELKKSAITFKSRH